MGGVGRWGYGEGEEEEEGRRRRGGGGGGEGEWERIFSYEFRMNHVALHHQSFISSEHSRGRTWGSARAI